MFRFIYSNILILVGLFFFIMRHNSCSRGTTSSGC